MSHGDTNVWGWIRHGDDEFQDFGIPFRVENVFNEMSQHRFHKLKDAIDAHGHWTPDMQKYAHEDTISKTRVLDIVQTIVTGDNNRYRINHGNNSHEVFGEAVFRLARLIDRQLYRQPIAPDGDLHVSFMCAFTSLCYLGWVSSTDDGCTDVTAYLDSLTRLVDEMSAEVNKVVGLAEARGRNTPFIGIGPAYGPSQVHLPHPFIRLGINTRAPRFHDHRSLWGMPMEYINGQWSLSDNELKSAIKDQDTVNTNVVVKNRKEKKYIETGAALEEADNQREQTAMSIGDATIMVSTLERGHVDGLFEATTSTLIGIHRATDMHKADVEKWSGVFRKCGSITEENVAKVLEELGSPWGGMAELANNDALHHVFINWDKGKCIKYGLQILQKKNVKITEFRKEWRARKNRNKNRNNNITVSTTIRNDNDDDAKEGNSNTSVGRSKRPRVSNDHRSSSSEISTVQATTPVRFLVNGNVSNVNDTMTSSVSVHQVMVVNPAAVAASSSSWYHTSNDSVNSNGFRWEFSPRPTSPIKFPMDIDSD